MTEKFWWRASVTLSIIFVVLLGLMCYGIDQAYHTNPNQLVFVRR